jgi:hypothetical protein
MAGQTVNFFLGNHPYVAQETLRDFCMAYSGALTGLGHSVLFAPTLLPPPTINLVFEHFDDQFTGLFEPILARYRVGLICTEPFAGNPMSETAYRQMRVTNMKRVGSRCRFVWCVDPLSFAAHKSAFDHPRVYQTPIGYTETLADMRSVPPSEKIWDVCFTGSMTDYREALLGRLKAAGLNVIHGLFPHFIRRSVMERSRLHLTLKQDSDLSLPSQMRMAYCLANDLALVSDLGDRVPETPAEAYVTAVAPSQLVEWCMDYIAGRQDVAAMAAKVASFKSECRMDRLTAAIVAESFAS